MADGFDVVSFLMGKQAAGGGGDITVESKSFDANGTYAAPTGKAYSPVTVRVPNSYSAGDEGKVVSNGQLVAQGSDTVTQNGTVDTTLINSLEVNVSGGGGSNWKLLTSAEFQINTTSTSETAVGTVQLPSLEYADPNTVLWVHMRDKAGKRAGYVYGSDTLFFHWQLANENTNSISIRPATVFYVNSTGKYAASVGDYGVFAGSLGYKTSAQSVSIKSRYTSSYGTINGTFKVDVYKLTPASGMTIFD